MLNKWGSWLVTQSRKSYSMKNNNNTMGIEQQKALEPAIMFSNRITFLLISGVCVVHIWVNESRSFFSTIICIFSQKFVNVYLCIMTMSTLRVPKLFRFLNTCSLHFTISMNQLLLQLYSNVNSSIWIVSNWMPCILCFIPATPWTASPMRHPIQINWNNVSFTFDFMFIRTE